MFSVFFLAVQSHPDGGISSDVVYSRRRVEKRQVRFSTPTMDQQQFLVNEFKWAKAAATSVVDQYGW